MLRKILISLHLMRVDFFFQQATLPKVGQARLGVLLSSIFNMTTSSVLLLHAYALERFLMTRKHSFNVHVQKPLRMELKLMSDESRFC